MESIADITAALERIRKYDCPKKEVMKLIERDLCSGFSIEDVQFYYKRKISVERMALISECIHKGISKDDLAKMLKFKMNDTSLSNIFKYLKDGVPYAVIEPFLQSKNDDRFIKLSNKCKQYLAQRNKAEKDTETTEKSDQTGNDDSENSSEKSEQNQETAEEDENAVESDSGDYNAGGNEVGDKSSTDEGKAESEDDNGAEENVEKGSREDSKQNALKEDKTEAESNTKSAAEVPTAVQQTAALPAETIRLFESMQQTMLSMQKMAMEQQSKSIEMIRQNIIDEVKRDSERSRADYEKKISDLEKEIEENSAKITEYQKKEAEERERLVAEKKRAAAEKVSKENTEDESKTSSDDRDLADNQETGKATETKEETEKITKAETTERPEQNTERVSDRKEQVMRQGFPVTYSTILTDGAGRVISAQPVDMMSKRGNALAMLGALVGVKKKSRKDLLTMALSGELKVGQLVQIKHGIELGLTEDQLCTIIKSKCDADTMKEVVEMAALQNSKGY